MMSQYTLFPFFRHSMGFDIFPWKTTFLPFPTSSCCSFNIRRRAMTAWIEDVDGCWMILDDFCQGRDGLKAFQESIDLRHLHRFIWCLSCSNISRVSCTCGSGSSQITSRIFGHGGMDRQSDISIYYEYL